MKSKRNILLGAVAALALTAGAAGAQYYATKNYEAQGGALWVVGGEQDIASGGLLDVKQGGQLAVDKATPTANSGNSYTVTANSAAVVVTTDSLSTAAGSTRTITINNSLVTASSDVQATWTGGTNSAGTPIIKAVPGAGTLTLTLYNDNASAAFNGTFVVSVLVV